MATPGQILAGRYRLERLLARGGHGAVFVAEQLATEARVAVKVLLPHVLDDEDALRRFELEAKVAGRISSEYIVRTLDAGVDPSSGLPFIVMELLEGRSLGDAVLEEGPFSALDTTTCILQVARALDKAHGARAEDGRARAIVHRDLKPENLFLTTREDGQRVVKVLDFGTAKIVSESIARSRSIQGSPLYIAYEQLSGGAVSPKTDVWALGLIAFFLLTGKPYWRAALASSAGLSAIFAEILHMPLVPPTARARELGVEPLWPPSFDVWFQRCVTRDPEARFETAGEAAHALLEALLGADGAADEDLDSPPPESERAVLEDAAIPLRRGPRGALLAGALAGSAVLIYVLAPVFSAAPAANTSLAASSPAMRASVARTAAAALTATAPTEQAPLPVADARSREQEVAPVRHVHRARRAPSPEPRTAPAPTSAPESQLLEQPTHILNSPIYSER